MQVFIFLSLRNECISGEIIVTLLKKKKADRLFLFTIVLK